MNVVPGRRLVKFAYWTFEERVRACEKVSEARGQVQDVRCRDHEKSTWAKNSSQFPHQLKLIFHVLNDLNAKHSREGRVLKWKRRGSVSLHPVHGVGGGH